MDSRGLRRLVRVGLGDWSDGGRGGWSLGFCKFG